MESTNVVSALYEVAAAHPDRLAIALPAAPGKPLPKTGPIPYHPISFRELATETNRTARGLLAAGFHPGDRVLLLVPPSLEFFTLLYAFIQTGLIPVLIDPGIGFKHLKTCINEAAPVGFIGIARAQIARLALGWGRASIQKVVTVGPRLFWGGKRLKSIKKKGGVDAPPELFPATYNQLCLIAFTSGSTGVPKGVQSTHGNFRHQIELLRSTFDMRPGDMDVPTFPPFALLNPILGISSIIPDMDPTRPAQVDPERLLRTIDQFQANSMFGSPTLIDRVGRYAVANQRSIPSLRRVFSAGAPVPARAIRRFAGLLPPAARIFTPYGATEAMPVAAISSAEILQEEIQQRTQEGGGICIGRPLAGIDMKIIRITDAPIHHWSEEWEVPLGTVGEIIVKGPNVTHAYFNRPQANQLAKIREGECVWHRMGDLGYQDDSGRIWFCGRKSHRVRLPDKELYTIQCESIFNYHPQVHRTALVQVEDEAVLCVETSKDQPPSDQAQLRTELLEWAASRALTRDIRKVLFHPSFPVDIRHNAKIFREQLARWAAKV